MRFYFIFLPNYYDYYLDNGKIQIIKKFDVRFIKNMMKSQSLDRHKLNLKHSVWLNN